MSSERLQKVLARAGYGSRRKCEELIVQQRVRIDGKVATLGEKVDISHQTVTVDGETIKLPEEFAYFIAYKPRGILSDTEDSRGRKTVADLVPSDRRLFTVGRLDLTSEGLVLLTDDGGLANRLLHPRYGHEREYRVLVKGRPSEDVLNRWRRGINLEEGRTLPADVRWMGVEAGNTLLAVVMREGKKRQIRRVAAVLGHPVLRLVRVRIGPIWLGDLKPGEARPLTGREVRALKSETQARRSKPKPGPRKPSSKRSNFS